MNVIYPIRNIPKSPEEDMIFKFSLRSLEMYGVQIEKVYVLGARRDWFSNHITVVDCDLYGVGNNDESKFKKVGEKMIFACDLGVPFVLMNDDFLLMDTFEAEKREWYYSGTIADALSHKNKGQAFKRMLIDTCEKYGRNSRSVKNFTTHTPFLVDKPRLMHGVHFSNSNQLISFRQSYAFIRGIVDMEEDHHVLPSIKEMKEDCKIYESKTVEGWNRLFDSNKYISINNDSVKMKNLLKALHQKFPHKSIYERRNGI